THRADTVSSTRSLHDALPISPESVPEIVTVWTPTLSGVTNAPTVMMWVPPPSCSGAVWTRPPTYAAPSGVTWPSTAIWRLQPTRSEEHTSELQSLTNLVCRLL